MMCLRLTMVPLVLVALFLARPLPAQTAWVENLPKAQAQARAENKALLLNFTGSDWCGWCIRLKKEVFTQTNFLAYAEKNLVLVELDFPQRKAQSATVKKANRALSDKYKIEGYPTLVVLDGEGRELGRLSYEPGGTRPFLAKLAKLTGRAPEIPITAPKPAVAKTEKPDAPLFNGAPAAAPARFTELVLKGISGPKQNRLALINNQTFSAGETMMIQVSGQPVKVRCVEVREKSVVVAVAGEKSHRELKLRERL